MNDNWLNQLAPDQAPTAPGWWPPAPGWWALLLLCAALLIWMLWRRYFSSQAVHRRQRRAALQELQRLRNGVDITHTARAIQNLLRRYALSVCSQPELARMSGDAWLGFVVAQGGVLFQGETGGSLLQAAFGGVAESDRREQWFAAAEQFVRCAPRRDGSLPESRPSWWQSWRQPWLQRWQRRRGAA
jgi:hypothetical protein